MKRTLGWLLYSLGWLWLIGSAIPFLGNANVDSATRLGYALGGLCGSGALIAGGLFLLLAVRRAAHAAAVRAATAARPGEGSERSPPATP